MFTITFFRKGLTMKKLLIVTMIAMTSFYTSAAIGQVPQNGGFDTDLSGWTIIANESDAVLWYQGTAVLSNPGDYPIDPAWPFQNSFEFLSAYSQLSGNDDDSSGIAQAFTVPSNTDELSFDVSMETYSVMSTGETDTLTVKLWYGAGLTSSELIFEVDSTDVDWVMIPGNYPVNESELDDIAQIFVHHVIYETTVVFDLSPWAGQDVYLEFVLEHDNTDDVKTAATIDNVAISTSGDTTPPVVTVCGMTELWPPNHKYHTFSLSDIVQSVIDDSDGDIDIDDNCVILSIYSDEPEDVKGNGDGSTLDDIVILGPSSFKVRSERQGKGNGRVYGVAFEMSDSSGNTTQATAYLGVPHDKSGKRTIVDDGSESGYTVYQ